MPRKLKRDHGRGDLHFITFRVRRSPPKKKRIRDVPPAPFELRGAPFEAPLKDRGKQGKQKFFASWFDRGRGGEKA
jgi:hypothetical protein